MIKLARWSVLVLLMTIIFTSCGDDLHVIEPDANNQNVNIFSLIDEEEDNNFTIDMLCFEFVYPIIAINPDGTNATINDEIALQTFIQTAIDTEVYPTLNFPIQVINDDNETITIGDDEALCDLAFECFDDCDCAEDEECFEINFPVTIILPDSSTVTVNDWEELETSLDNYYNINPNNDGEISFVFPITVTILDDNTILTVNNDDDLEVLFEECYGNFHDDCFEFQFPMSFTMSDGSTLTANSEAELDTAFDAWITANPNDSIGPILNFPITVIYDDGTTETVNNDADLGTLFEECFADEWDDCGKITPTDAIVESKASLEKRIIIKTTRAKNVAKRKQHLIVD